MVLSQKALKSRDTYYVSPGVYIAMSHIDKAR